MAPKFTSVPPVENVELYYSFFQWHQNLIGTNQALKSANPAQSATLDQQMATTLQVAAGELPAVVANTQQVAQAQATLAANKAAGLNPAGGARDARLTAAQQAAQYDFARIRIAAEGFRTLNQSLTPASWTGIHGFIFGAFKTQPPSQTVQPGKVLP